MGISIHYSGRIADKRSLPKLIEEVREIAEVHHWKYKVYETEFPDSGVENKVSAGDKHDGLLYGIDFTPEGSEPVSVCFLSNGKMSSPIQLAAWGNFEAESILRVESEEWDENGLVSRGSEDVLLNKEKYSEYLCMCSVKTQYSGPDAHAMIIGVLRYISDIYLVGFALTDESKLWETGDNSLMRHNFEQNGRLIDSFGKSLNNEIRLPDEDVESFIRRIVEEFRKKKNR